MMLTMCAAAAEDEEDNVGSIRDTHDTALPVDVHRCSESATSYAVFPDQVF